MARTPIRPGEHLAEVLKEIRIAAAECTVGVHRLEWD